MKKLHNAIILAISTSLIAVVLGLSRPTSTEARSLNFTKSPVNTSKLHGELEAATGLTFFSRCSTCAAQGWIAISGGKVEVHVYEILTPDNPKVSTVTWTTEMGEAITTTVENHTP